MFRNSNSSRKDRRAIILLVVVTLLTLFAVVGISFVIYAENSASSAQVANAAEQGGHTQVNSPTARGNPFEAPPIPTDIANKFIGQLIYGVPDDESGAYSALRGQDLARLIYGWSSPLPTTPATNPHTVAFNGIGRPKGSAAPAVYGQPDDRIINYTYFQSDNTIVDPERFYANATSFRTNPSLPITAPYFPNNANYTYPDLNNFFLAVVRASDGKVLAPSFHRDWLINWASNSPDLASPAAVNASKYRTLRPNPVSNQNFRPAGSPTGLAAFPNYGLPFPNPDGTYGDVQNLLGAPGGYDSFWMDIDAPVLTWRGKRYKAIVAPLIIDLDGRVNVNIAGNRMSPAQTQASNQGWGRWEVDIANILPPTATAPTDASMLVGLRYGTASGQVPEKIYEPVPGTPPNQIHPPVLKGMIAAHYAKPDYDGSDGTQGGAPPKPRYTLDPTQDSLRINPFFPPRFDNASVAERTNHAAMYNPYFLNSDRTKNTDDKTFGLYDMYLLNSRFNYDSDNYARSQLGQALPTVFGSNYQQTAPSDANARFMLTLASTGLDRLGNIPWYWANNGQSAYRQQAQQPQPGVPVPPVGPPTGQPIPFPPAANGPPASSEFSAGGQTPTWQAVTTALGAIDLDKPLTDYRVDPTKNYDQPGNVNPADANTFGRAQNDRMTFAKDIFDRLCIATGARFDLTTPVTAAEGSPEYAALRYLAQLAVNIVDYIDNDDYMTPFPWTQAVQWASPPQQQEVLWGTEMPRLVINESYVQCENHVKVDPIISPNAIPDQPGSDTAPAIGQPGLYPAPGDPNAATFVPKATYYRVRCWLELHNPLTPPGGSDSALSHNGAAPLWFTPQGAMSPQPVYRVVLTKKPNTRLRDVTNLKGDPDPRMTPPVQYQQAAPITDVKDPYPMDGDIRDLAFFDTVKNAPPPPPNDLLAPSNASYGRTTGNSSFFLFGPPRDIGMGAAPDTVPGGPPNDITHRGLQYDVPSAVIQANGGRPPLPGFLLQRLACPHAPFDPNTNPYITIDYVQYDKPQQMNNALTIADINGNKIDPATTAPETRHSWGRRQPLAADTNQLLAITLTQPVAGSIHHAFLRHNGQDPANPPQNGDANLQQPFDWLCHLDRPLVSPVELLEVSGWKPHELTQQFVIGQPANPTRHAQRAPWVDPPGPVNAAASIANQSRLFRALGYFQVRDRTIGMPVGGRLPGKININSIWDPQILRALADADNNNSPNGFTDPTIAPANWDNKTSTVTPPGTTVWERLLLQRSPGPPVPGIGYKPGQNDRPIMGLAAPITPSNDIQYPLGSGIETTLLNPNLLTLHDPNGQPVSNAHPYEQNELANKIFNNVTTRSNVFAVWLTVAYFEVENVGPYNSANRPILGRELGSDDGTAVRHRFFSIIDRTNLSIDTDQTLPVAQQLRLQGPKPVFLSFETDSQTPGTVTVPVPATGFSNNRLVGDYDGERWEIGQGTIGQGTRLLIDTGTNEEWCNPQAPFNPITVSSVSYLGPNQGGTITFQCYKPHARGCLIQFVPNFADNSKAVTPGVVPPRPSMLGNPGPQPNFNPTSERYRNVVPLLVEIP